MIYDKILEEHIYALNEQLKEEKEVEYKKSIVSSEMLQLLSCVNIDCIAVNTSFARAVQVRKVNALITNINRVVCATNTLTISKNIVKFVDNLKDYFEYFNHYIDFKYLKNLVSNFITNDLKTFVIAYCKGVIKNAKDK